MDKKLEKKIVFKGDFEDVIEVEKHYYLISKKNRICVLPYTISTSGLLDKIGVVEDINYIKNEKTFTLISDYISTDDKTDLVAANRILFEILKINISNAYNWMYLGSLYNNLTSDSLIKIYAVNISDIEIKNDESVQEEMEAKKFKLLDSSKVVQSDDMLFLAAYLRLFNYFYVNSLNQNNNE